MRFYDFANDMRETSQRIAERNAYLDTDALAKLTIRTLMRPDVIAYMDGVAQTCGVSLPPSRRIVYYVVLYAFLVNVRPRPIHQSVVDFASGLLKRLSRPGLMEAEHVLSESRRVFLPGRVVASLSGILKIDTRQGFYCKYANAAPDEKLFCDSVEDSRLDAQLILWQGGPVALPARVLSSKRLVFSDVIFQSSHYTLSGCYIQTAR